MRRRSCSVRRIGTLGEMPIAILDHHNGRIDEHADGQRQPAQRHDVGADVQVIHGDECGQHGDG